ncbi:MAG: hypothetical protein GVY22_11045 [Gammaproteobacteria bacterium]|nr:hypothetical protein [Gammaproteobacteria bacterium]
MNMKRTTTHIAVAAALGMVSMQSFAEPITNWDFDATLEWVNADFSAGGTGGTTFEDASVLSWGDSGQVTGNGIPALGDDRSGLYIGDSDGNPIIVTSPDVPTISGQIMDGVSENTFTITHVNNPISTEFSTLSSAELLTTLTIRPAGEAGPEETLLDTGFTVTFSETLNQPPCQFTQGPDCADIFGLGITELTGQNFEIDGIEYNVVIDSVDFVDVGGGELGLVTNEQALTTAGFNFQVSAVVDEIPTPGILALFGTGLVGLGFIVARRRRG